LTTYISQGSAATDLSRGGRFNSSFLHGSFVYLTVKTLWNLLHFYGSFAIWR